jgi:hypothetical protein
MGILLYCLSSCDEALNSCRSQSERTLNIGFYTAHHSKSSIVEADTTLDSVYVFAIGHEDSVFYQNSSLTGISLPLSQFSDSGVYILKHKNTNNELVTDTIKTIYQRIRIFASYKCGYYTNFAIDSFSISLKYDSLIISQSNVTYEGKTNFKIYIHNPLID